MNHLSSMTHKNNADKDLTQRIVRPKVYVTPLPPSLGLTAPSSSEGHENSSNRKEQQLDEITKALDRTDESDLDSLAGFVFGMK